MSNEILNQTQFNDQEPMFEQTVPMPTDKQKITVAPKKKSPLILVLIIAGIFFLILIILLILIASKNKKTTEKTQEPTKTNAETVISDPLKEQLEAFEIQLNEADPSKKDLPYPGVDKEIGID